MNTRSIAIGFLSALAALAFVSIFSLLVGCAFPHVEPAMRTESDEQRAAVALSTSCTEGNPLNDMEQLDPVLAMRNHRPDVEWQPDRIGAGCVISERYILTSAHLVRCSFPPSVRVLLSNGRIVNAVVDRDDAMFHHGKGSGSDLARLELLGTDGFGLGIAPPRLPSPDASEIMFGDKICEYTRSDARCGEMLAVDDRIAQFAAPGDLGRSGACDYDHGLLVGVTADVLSTVDSVSLGTEAIRVGPYWLEGT